MRFFTLLSILFCFSAWQAHATHNRSGEITYHHLGGNTYEVNVVTFTDYTNTSADRDSLELNWGDGHIDTIPRVQITELFFPQVRMNTYRGTHTYGGFGTYKISMQDLNRVAGVLDINGGASVNVPFYVEDTLRILDPSIWGPLNNSPVMGTLAIDTAFVHEVYHHTMAAYDPDGLDSLHYEFYTPLQDAGFPVSNYQTLTQLFPATTLTIDPNTGLVTWDSPPDIGIVNIGIIVREFRRRYNPDGTVKQITEIGNVKRDLQIIILKNNNNPPVLAAVHDTCVVAGTVLNIPIHATDPDAGQTVTVSGNGGPFVLTESPAVLTQTLPGGTGFWNGTLTWNTVCDHVQPGYYQVLMTAKDDFPNAPATDIETFRIKVVAPPPQNLTATPSGNSVALAWQNPYECSAASRFRGFSVWRRQGSNPFDIDSCTPGLAGKGYVKIASGLHDYNYTDNNVVIGVNYCYRVLAEFGSTTSLGWVLNFVESLPSNEACAYLERDLPVITHVDVATTDAANGSINVDWTNPKPVDLNTTQHPGPYRYRVYRAEGFGAGPLTLVHESNAATLGELNDTAFTDLGLNTLDHPYAYFVSFFYTNPLTHQLDSLGQTATASSVYLTVNFSSQTLLLSWEEHVPWTNTSYIIYRKAPGSSTFDSLTTVSASPYTDTALINDSTYCYRVNSIGSYADSGFVNPIVNRSEEKCGVPKDTVGPCPPTLAVTNICNDDGFTLGEFTNLLNWNKPATACGGDAIKYYLYYAPRSDQPLTLLDSSHAINDTSFQHKLASTVAGCYALAAVDSYYNVGPLSNRVCVDNCPVYKLPNTFTPNGDGHNDVFHPVLPYRFIEKVNMKIFTSWGSLVFETTDPQIGWDGVNHSNNKQAPEGTYYYTCEVYEQRLDANGKPDATLDGFIHLYR